MHEIFATWTLSKQQWHRSRSTKKNTSFLGISYTIQIQSNNHRENSILKFRNERNYKLTRELLKQFLVEM